MPRLFVAIDIPERIKDDIIATYQAIPGARWLGESQIHITLRFIGEVDTPTEENIINCLRGLNAPAFTITLKGSGFFPPRKQPRILWVGIDTPGELITLQSKIERALVTAGIDPEKRKFHPHITVSRLSNSPVDKVAQYIASTSLFQTEPFAVSEFHLYASYLHKEGAHYVKEASFKLERSEYY